MRRWMLMAVMPTLLIAPTVASAQRPISVGLAGGVSVPQGNFGDGATTGWHALGTLALSTLMQPLGLRLDAAYNRFAYSDAVQAVRAEDGYESVSSATLNATYRLPMTDSPLSPYLISGLGAYRTECSTGPGCDATTRYGWNVGLGTKLYVLGFRSFLEGRYHRTERGDRDVNFFPVTFGLSF